MMPGAPLPARQTFSSTPGNSRPDPSRGAGSGLTRTHPEELRYEMGSGSRLENPGGFRGGSGTMAGRPEQADSGGQLLADRLYRVTAITSSPPESRRFAASLR